MLIAYPKVDKRLEVGASEKGALKLRGRARGCNLQIQGCDIGPRGPSPVSIMRTMLRETILRDRANGDAARGSIKKGFCRSSCFQRKKNLPLRRLSCFVLRHMDCLQVLTGLCCRLGSYPESTRPVTMLPDRHVTTPMYLGRPTSPAASVLQS